MNQLRSIQLSSLPGVGGSVATIQRFVRLWWEMLAEKQIGRGKKNQNNLPSVIASQWSRRSSPETKEGIKLFLEPFIFHYHNDLGFAGSFHVYLTTLVCLCVCVCALFFLFAAQQGVLLLCRTATLLSLLGEPRGWKRARTLAHPHAANQSHSSPAVPPVYLFLDSSDSLFILHATS